MERAGKRAIEGLKEGASESAIDQQERMKRMHDIALRVPKALILFLFLANSSGTILFPFIGT